MWKEEQRKEQHIELNPKIDEKNTRRNTELNIIQEMFVLHHITVVEHYPELHLAFLKVSELT